MTTLQEQARALGDPTRYGIFRHIADATHPVDIAELTEAFGLNHNAIRQHVAKLVHAGMVVEEPAPPAGRRGRPRLVYRLRPDVECRWGVTGPYERLSELLAEVIQTGDPPVEVGRRSVGRELLGGGDALSLLMDAMDRQGFGPSLRSTDDDRAELVLHTCPFTSAVLAGADAVCGIHLGIAQGIASRTGGRLVIDELVSNDPRHGDCRLRVHLASESGR